jgi:Zn-dependent peptidase ImmA (M78 family)
MNEHLHHIEELANNARVSIGHKKSPVDVNAVAEKLALKIVPFDFPQSFSGVLKKDKGVIGVNKNHPLVRQRFTIAHELGHFLLGHEADAIDEAPERPMPLEREANLFASHLLMPTAEVQQLVQKLGLDIRRLAREFNVSDQAMTIRLLGLNLVK